MAPIVVLDACVLFPPSLRNYLLQLGADAVIRPRWSNDIHDEWMRGVAARHPEVSHEALERTRRAMDAAIWDALVDSFHHRIAALDLPDPDDRHVLAAAIEVGAEAIVTINRRDFPEKRLAPYGLVCWSPDMLTQSLLRSDPAGVANAIRRISRRLSRPSHRPEEIAARLARLWLPKSGDALLATLVKTQED